MPTTDNLEIDHLEENTISPKTVVDQAWEEFDNALTEVLVVDFGDTLATVTLTTEQFIRNVTFQIEDANVSPTLAQEGTLNVAAVERGIFAVINDTDYPITVQLSGQSLTPPVVSAGDSAILTCDGSNVRIHSQGVTKIRGSLPGSPGAGDVIVLAVMAFGTTLPSGLSSSRGNAGTPPTSFIAECPIFKNGVEIGSMDFAIGATVATFDFASTVTFIGGDVIEVHAPNPLIPGLADVSLTLVGG